MLNLIKLNKNEKTQVEQQKNTQKHNASSVRTWNNSIYVFNKNTLNLIPVISKSAFTLIKGYFTLFNKIIEKKIRTKRLLFKFRRFSSNKIFISNGEFKHSNNKVIITLYMFNRQKANYLLFLKKWYLKKFFSKKLLSKKENFNRNLFRLFTFLNKKGLVAINNINVEKYSLIKTINNANLKKNIYVSNYIRLFYKKLLKNWSRKLLLYLYYKQLLYINRSKINYNYLQHLKKHLENLYNKNVEFNLVNVKRFYLNSDILSESIAMKISKNRRGILRYLKTFNNKIKIQKGVNLLNKSSYNINKNLTKKKVLYKNIINDLKYKHLTGYRIEASGRLTRRFTASRSVTRVIYKGNLLNIDTTYKGLSTPILKGNLESNLQHTKLSSTTRIGSFGIKGWVSGN